MSSTEHPEPGPRIPPDPPPRAIYDNPQFHSAYLTLPRQEHGLSHAPEWPTLRSLLGPTPFPSSTILDLGCGLGWFARWAASPSGGGASHVDALDISHKMIEKAITMTEQEGLEDRISYRVQDLSSLEFDESKNEVYDLVFSSLTLHYLCTDDLMRLLRQLHGVLRAGVGSLVVSVEHPIYTAPSTVPSPWFETLSTGKETRRIWPLESYADEGVREREWLGFKGVTKYHRTIQTWFESLNSCGFVVTDLVEWAPSSEQEKENGWDGERDRPMFLLLRAEKK